MEEKKIGYKDVFRQKEYLKMIFAALINRFGDSIDAIAFTWIVYELTGNAAWSAIIFGANRVPSVIITPLAGAWVEGRKKKTIMIVTDLIRALCVAFTATGYLLGFLQPWMLLVVTIAISTAEAFRTPANTALTPKILDKEYYEYGMSLMSTLCSIVELIGLAAAASIIAVIGTAGAIYVDMATFILSAFVILFVNTKEQNLQKVKFDGKEYLQTLGNGFSYVKKDKIVLFLLGIVVFLNAALVPLNSLQAPLASEILGGGAEILSVIGITLTLGMLLGSFIYPMVSKKLSPKVIMVLCALAIAAYYITVPACMPLYKSKVFMYGFTVVIDLVLGMAAGMASAFGNVFIVKRVKEEYLARVGSITCALGMAAMPVTSFIVSGLVAYVSTAKVFVVAGVAAVFVTIAIMFSKTLNEEKALEAEGEAESAV